MSFPIINLCQGIFGSNIYCDSPSFSEDYTIDNLTTINNDKGYLASSFIKPPIDITVSFNYPIDLERIGLKCKVGTCITDTISIYVSTESMNEINDKMKNIFNTTTKNNNNNKDIDMISIENKNNNGIPTKSSYLTLPTSNHQLPKGITISVPNNMNSNDQINNNHFLLDNNKLTKSTYLYDNINLLDSSNNNCNKVAQQKYIHQQFKFVGSVDNLHTQDDLYTYICNSSFNYQGQTTLPNSFLSKIQRQSQLKPFHSNSNLLNQVKSIRIRILKTYQSSCACLGGLEIWGIPSPSSTPPITIQQIYQTYQQQQQQQQQQILFNSKTFGTPFKSNLLSTLNNNNNINNSNQMAILDIFPKNKHYNNDDVMKVENNFNVQKSTSIISEFEEFMRSHPEITLNETGIPTIFLDPITLEMMNNPVTLLGSGNIVDRSTIETHFKNGFFTDPFTGLKMTNDDIETNHLLKSQIQTFITEKKKRKRLLKSHSMILRNQILANMQPQIATVQNNNNSNNNIENKENNNNNYYYSNSSQSNSLAASTSSTSSILNGGSSLGNSSSEIYNLLNSTNINFQNAEIILSMSKKDPSEYQLSKMPSQFSFIELPIKKNKK